MLPVGVEEDQELPVSASRCSVDTDLTRNQSYQHASAHHAAQTAFIPLPSPLKRRNLALKLGLWILKHEAHLLRLKGVVSTEDGVLLTLQWAFGDAQADIALFGRISESPPIAQMGLTVIAEEYFDFEAGDALIVSLESGEI